MSLSSKDSAKFNGKLTKEKNQEAHFSAPLI